MYPNIGREALQNIILFFVPQMSCNFWNSSHCQSWLLPPDKLNNSKTHITFNIYYCTIIHKLARSISTVTRAECRQQVIATAIVFLKRFYTKYSMAEVDPLLMCCTSFYMATKAEEAPCHVKTVVGQMKVDITDS